MSDPSTTNKVASVVNEILQALIEGAGTDAIEAAILANSPWVGLPFIKQTMETIVRYIAKYFYKQFAITTTKIIIDIQISGEVSNAVEAFKTLQMAVASGDDSAIKKASGDLDQAYASLIHYDGSASPNPMQSGSN